MEDFREYVMASLRGEYKPSGVKATRPPSFTLVERLHACWLALHRYPLDNPWNPQAASDWYAEWERTIPHIGCDCRKHWRELVDANPPDFTDAESFWLWGFHRHNDVNRKLNKPELAIDEAKAIYQ